MTPKQILERLEVSLGSGASPLRLSSAIEVELVNYFSLSAIEAAERAETMQNHVGKLISSRSFEAEKQGTNSVLTMIGTMADLVAGACFILPSDNAGVAAAKMGRFHHAALLGRIRALTFAQFETFGKLILKELGALKPRVTPHAGDQGIDFFGDFSLGQLHDLPKPFLKLAHDVRLLFAGQAKHYPNTTIGPNIVRELIGSVSLARTKTFSTDGIDIFQELEIRPFSPVVAMLFTTGDISSGAYRLAESAGIVAKSGDQLAAFLADRGIGMNMATNPPGFDNMLFDEWLNPGTENAPEELP